ncbi:hypothetical protein LCGC14_2858270, partial [marine sediment metagenome]
FGSPQGQISASVMSQIAASANQVMRPFHEAFVNRYEDIDNDWLADIKERGVKPYDWKYPDALPDNTYVSADYDIEIPGDMVGRATTARMLDPDFRLSYTYVMKKLFPDIEDPMQERAQVRADQAEMHPSNSLIALIQYYRRQAAYLIKIGDVETGKLYDTVADATLAMLTAEQGGQEQPQQGQSGRGEIVPERTQLPARTARAREVVT